MTLSRIIKVYVFIPVKKYLVFPILSIISRLFLRYDITKIDDRLSKIEAILRATKKNYKELEWLFENRQERMDAMVGFFDPERARYHIERYEFASKYIEGKVIADIACGTGYGSETLLKNGKPVKIYGVDISDDAIEYAKKIHGADEIEFINASGDKTGLPSECVDTVVSFETIEHLPDDIGLLKEFRRIIKPGGQLIISTPHNWPKDHNPYHFNVYNREVFCNKLSKYFEVVELYNFNSNTLSCNKGKPGCVETTKENENEAECYLAICKRK